jgi:hypothetical protein
VDEIKLDNTRSCPHHATTVSEVLPKREKFLNPYDDQICTYIENVPYHITNRPTAVFFPYLQDIQHVTESSEPKTKYTSSLHDD